MGATLLMSCWRPGRTSMRVLYVARPVSSRYPVLSLLSFQHSGRSPLVIAAQSANVDLVTKLVRRGADVRVVWSLGCCCSWVSDPHGASR